MSARHRALALALFVSFLVNGCGAVAPAATSVPAGTPLPPSATLAPATVALVESAPTDTPLPPSTPTRVPPTPAPSATPTLAPLLSLENSPQLFGRTETFQIGLGDLDGDGDLDAVLANMGANASQVWFNDGTGQFTDSGQRLTQQGHGLGLGDLDGDGDLDIFLTCAHYGRGGAWSKKPSRVYLNDGRGVFQDSGQDHGDMELSGNGVNLIDLDGDGDLDVFVSNGDHRASEVWLNDGTGRLVDSGVRLESPSRHLATWPSLGDLDGDGDLDVVEAGFQGKAEIWLNRTPVPAGRTNTWIRRFEGPDYGALFDLVLTEDGNVLAVGATNHLHMPPYSGDALFVELTLDGTLLWERTWGSSGYEQAFSVAPAGDGGYYVFGETDSYGAGDRDFFLLKIDRDGSEEWFKTYGGAHREWPYGMQRLSNGDLLIYGFTEPEAGHDRDPYALRLEPDGDLIWEYTVTSPGEELVIDALETVNGDLVLAVILEEDGGLAKLDAAGNVLWARRYELAGWQYASQIAPTDDGGFLLAGFSMSSGSRRQADTWLARCTPTGELEWEKSFGDAARDDYATSLIRLKDGTYLMGGIGNGMLLTNVDQDGNVLWRRSLVGQTVFGAGGLIELEDGGYLVAGFIQITNGRSYDAILLRINAEGQLEP